MTKPHVILADLTHTAQGISALYFPLGAGFVASYAQQEMGDSFAFDLFKFPEDTAAAIIKKKPRVIAFSTYAWNFRLALKMATWAKTIVPEAIIVFGGPNFPVVEDEKKAFMVENSIVDFYIQNEGEIGFVEVLRTLEAHDFDLEKVHDDGEKITNCCYLAGDDLIAGDVERILNVNDIPSPYLTGMFDKFFDAPLVPMLETTRGCPFSCAFCADGLDSKNRVVRFETDRVREELNYIQARIQNVDELVITDLNFGMYKQDRLTAEYLADLQANTKWPRIVKASAGKNQPERIIETASLLKGSWMIGSAVQSTDDEVLENINRSNIATDAFRQFIDFANSQSDGSLSYSEIILALPGDTREKHLKSLRSGIENNVNTLRMYQAMMLMGTSMASQQSREKFKLGTRFRVLPGGIGVYKFGDAEIPIVETEEIIVSSRDMPFDDYVSCRVMNLLVETYINNDLFEEVFASLEAMGIKTFDVLERLHSDIGSFSPRVTRIIESFIRETVEDLYETQNEAETFATRPENMAKFMSGDLGGNELLEHRAQLYLELEEVANILCRTIHAILAEKNLWQEETARFFEQLTAFVIHRKQHLHEDQATSEKQFDYDFKALSSNRFSVDPREIRSEDSGVNIQFYHTVDQKDYIQNTMNLYQNHPGGIGRMIQRSNLKMMYRNFDYA
jgi:radical SAM superfamily enzyme YgiQ (UPF0313 family)